MKDQCETEWEQSWHQYLDDLHSESDDISDLLSLGRKHKTKKKAKHSLFLTSSSTSSEKLPTPKGVLENISSSIAYDGEPQNPAGKASLYLTSTPRKLAEVKIEPGEIIQLDSALDPDWPRQIYVLVLETNSDKFLSIPFGPLPNPAMTGELETGIDEDGFRVLCAWNRQDIPKALMSRHFKMGHADSELLSDCRDLNGALTQREPIPPSLLGKVGPSPYAISSEKREYLDREESLFHSLQSL